MRIFFELHVNTDVSLPMLKRIFINKLFKITRLRPELRAENSQKLKKLNAKIELRSEYFMFTNPFYLVVKEKGKIVG